MTNYNGKIQNVRRRYDSIRAFIGKNEVHKAGDILCVSTKNDDDYNLFLKADGKSTFIELLKKRLVPSDVPENSVGSEQIIDDSVKLEDLDPDIRAILEQNMDALEPEEAVDRVHDIIHQYDPDYSPNGAALDTSGDDGEGDI